VAQDMGMVPASKIEYLNFSQLSEVTTP